MMIAGIGGGVASRYDSRPKQRIKSCYCNSIATINRKAPALLQGLLQLIFSEFANIYTRIFISPA